MSAPEVSTRAETLQPDAPPDISPTPPLLWWAFSIPTFAVMVYGMQVFLAPRMQARRAESDDERS